MKKLTDALAALMTLIALVWASDALRLVGIAVYTEQYIALLLAFATPLIFLTILAGRRSKATCADETGPGHGHRRVPWYDLLAASVGCALAV